MITRTTELSEGSSLRAASALASRGAARAATALRRAAAAWVVVAVLGQLVFAAYVAAFYGGALVAGEPTRWNRIVANGYVPGQPLGNATVGVHVLLALVVLVGGALQLSPRLRHLWPACHRWVGRAYLAAVALVTAAGVIMTFVRGTLHLGSIGVSSNALVIVVCLVMALGRVRARDLAGHRRWALRLYLSALGVWFFRTALMAWIVLAGGPVGFDPDTFRGPVISVLAFAQYLLPLAILELYLRAQRGGARARWGAAAALVLCTLVTALGGTVASRVLWLPHL